MGHDHSHEHGHGHEGHFHGLSADADRGKLAIALGLILGFMAVEVTVGIPANSPALLSDAAHMLTDATAIGLSLVALRLVQPPAKPAMTFGLMRTEILSAQFNGATLLVSRSADRLRGHQPADHTPQRRRRGCGPVMSESSHGLKSRATSDGA